MSEKKHLRVVVGSPGDVKEERDMLGDIVDRINRHIASQLGYHLDLTKWETNGYPDFHPDGTQGILDPILDFPTCDIFIGIFWHKFGTPTKDGKTGTEHEFDEAVKEWQNNHKHHIMFYFNQKPYTATTSKDAIQLTRVLQFKESFPKEGLYWTYNGKEGFEKMVYDNLANLLNVRYKAKIQESPEPPKRVTRPEKFDGEHDIFVGRDDQIRDILYHMNDFFVNGNKESRIVTIWGMGGIGKSALAYHVMHEFEKTHNIQIIPIYFES
ncbi:MAG: hypothetical protein KC444_10300, partial [Nitrosopumilus sp.]|nr:hypothetical protein [Nitrosopumilus sp.]